MAESVLSKLQYWQSFLNFWIMRELGQEDAILRNYDVMSTQGKGGGSSHLYLAIRRLGEPARTQEDALNWLSEIAQRFVNMGAERPDIAVLHNRLRGWYVWDRIRMGEYKQWFLSEAVKARR